MRRLTLAISALAALLVGLSLPSLALAEEFAIQPNSVTIESLDSEGNPEYVAGSHPDTLRIGFGLTVEGTGTTAKDFIFDLTPGIASYAGSVPTCSRFVFSSRIEECPKDTQVGVLNQDLQGSNLEIPVVNLEPAPDQAAAFGVKPLWTVPFAASLRPDDFGLHLAAPDLVQIALGSGSIELWGVPADHQSGSPNPRSAFLTLPTRCGSMTATMTTRSWIPNAPWLSQSATSPPLEDCTGLPFAPALSMKLDSPLTDSQTGARIEATMFEDRSPEGRASSQIKNVMLQFPEGVAVSPAGAQRLRACTDAQFGVDSSAAAACPSASKLGSVELESPLLHDPLHGTIYLGTEQPGQRFRMFVSAPGPGVSVKLISYLRADPLTGRLSASLENLPQIPLSRLALSLNGGNDALLATPLACGDIDAFGELDPYSGGSPANSKIPLSISARPNSHCGGTATFSPQLVAGSNSDRAGRKTTFSLTLRRQDGEQLPSRLAVTLPRGLNGAFGAIERCDAARAQSGNCPASSKIGDAVAEVGPGENPASLRGEAFLTGPYRGAPFGIEISFDANIGPFDLGTVATRATLSVDRHTGQVQIKTDQLPRIVEGVPIRFRTIGLDINRPGLLTNPTSCTPTQIEASLQGLQGGTAATNVPFVLNGCNRLGFKPRIHLSLTGENELHESGRPGLAVSVRTHSGQTNLRSLSLSLPRALKFSPAHIQEICSRPDALAGLCSNHARVGTVSARTPLLGEKLKGPIFVVQPHGNGLPDLWLSLGAMGVQIDLEAKSSRKDGRFVTTITELPDLPLSNFKLRLPDGERSILKLRNGLCAGSSPLELQAPLDATGQDGAYRRMQARVNYDARCGSRSKAEKAHRKSRGKA